MITFANLDKEIAFLLTAWVEPSSFAEQNCPRVSAKARRHCGMQKCGTFSLDLIFFTKWIQHLMRLLNRARTLMNPLCSKILLYSVFEMPLLQEAWRLFGRQS
jgi:hypothetical protein